MDYTFRTARKGYDKCDVDEYIINLCKSYERSLSAQKERIENLKIEIDAKEKLIREYNDKKDSITRSITMAVEKAKQIEYASKVRYALEGERLKLFSDRWTRYCENVVNHVDRDTAAATKKFISKMSEEIKSD
ncbi:MAG: DivIVA domain-containing protein, partial [Clostridia bacterium]|nr:DivIVA domain-containing protein [Clostridia bacterium]